MSQGLPGPSFAESLVEESPDALIALSLEGRILFWNRGAHAIFGYGRDEAVGRSVEELIVPGDRRAEARRKLAEVLVEGSLVFETTRRRKDGSFIVVDVTKRLVRDAAGRPLFIAVNKKDVTPLLAERRVAEDALKVANQELEAFSYSVAHDLRAPLRAMNGFAQVLLDTSRERLDPEGQDWLAEILLGAKKMGDLIDGLLSLARIVRSEVAPERTDLSALAREAADRLRAAEPARAVELTVQDGLHADMDPRLSRALLENLLGNAWKFTGKTAAAHIAFGATVREGALAFFVRDNGAGFDMAFAARLFAPFQRLHTAAEFPGTGIGLATAQRIVHRHGGRIWAEGALNGGASFYFTVPARGSQGAA